MAVPSPCKMTVHVKWQTGTFAALEFGISMSCLLLPFRWFIGLRQDFDNAGLIPFTTAQVTELTQAIEVAVHITWGLGGPLFSFGKLFQQPRDRKIKKNRNLCRHYLIIMIEALTIHPFYCYTFITNLWLNILRKP